MKNKKQIQKFSESSKSRMQKFEAVACRMGDDRGDGPWHPESEIKKFKCCN